MTLRVTLILGLLALAGCQAPWIRPISLYPSNPAAERASYTDHDPFPDSSLGPNTFGRPPAAATQRSEPRRTLEASIPAMTGPGIPGGANRQMLMPPPPSTYPNTITP